MKLSSREKGMVIFLVLVAIIVFLVPNDEELSLNRGSNINKTVINILIAKFKRIKPFDFKMEKKKENTNLTIKRNIFQYGVFIPQIGGIKESGNDKQLGEIKNATLSNSKNSGSQVNNIEDSPPPIDFKVIGIIAVKGGVKAAVITKGYELFVFKEKDTMFDKFILESIDRNSVKIGFKGFKEVKTINLEDKRRLLK